jgi:hypothetical protein
LGEFVDVYLRQHGGEPETVDKLRWLLAKSVRVFGDRRLGQLRPPEIAAWRMTIPIGHRFEATQALRQVLNRAVEWGLIDVNPAKHGVDNPQRRRTEKRPFESWEGWSRSRPSSASTAPSSCSRLRPGCGRASGSLSSGATSIVSSGSCTCAAAIGTVASSTRRPRRACVPSRYKPVPSPRSTLYPGEHGELVFPASDGGHFDLHNFRNRYWQPAQEAAAIEPRRRVYNLRHTFATFVLRAGISTFDLSRYMGASLTMIDRHYGHLARDGREHAIKLLDVHSNHLRAGGW